ncbi:MAG: DUF5602 domain-containing protein [Proteobacteria bacterium]|nr:DUF5602 domain-containing protein [Pseudomonadota bacterium]
MSNRSSKELRKGVVAPALIALGLLSVGLAPALAAETGKARVHAGAPVRIGQGTARVVVATNAAGEPTSVGVVFDASALDGLPAARPGHPEYEYVLAMPKGAAKTGHDHVTVNWNPEGHDPKGIYSVPHFDFHFYLVSRAEQEGVTFRGVQGAEGGKTPARELLPAGYVVPPDTAVEKMGIHGVDPGGPEFRGKPFAETFIYGYYKGHLTFIEPMVAISFLRTKPDITRIAKTPAAYSLPGHYPGKYRIGYDSARNQYTVSLIGLRPWRMP